MMRQYSPNSGFVATLYEYSTTIFSSTPLPITFHAANFRQTLHSFERWRKQLKLALKIVTRFNYFFFEKQISICLTSCSANIYANENIQKLYRTCMKTSTIEKFKYFCSIWVLLKKSQNISTNTCYEPIFPSLNFVKQLTFQFEIGTWLNLISFEILKKILISFIWKYLRLNTILPEMFSVKNWQRISFFRNRIKFLGGVICRSWLCHSSSDDSVFAFDTKLFMLNNWKCMSSL